MMFCPSGRIIKFTDEPNAKYPAESIPEGEFCATQRVSANVEKYWFPDSNTEKIAEPQFKFNPGQTEI